MVAGTWLVLKCISQCFLNFELRSKLTACGTKSEEIFGLQRKRVVFFFGIFWLLVKAPPLFLPGIHEFPLILSWLVVTAQASTPAPPSPPAFLLPLCPFYWESSLVISPAQIDSLWKQMYADHCYMDFQSLPWPTPKSYICQSCQMLWKWNTCLLLQNYISNKFHKTTVSCTWLLPGTQYQHRQDFPRLSRFYVTWCF